MVPNSLKYLGFVTRPPERITFRCAALFVPTANYSLGLANFCLCASGFPYDENFRNLMTFRICSPLTNDLRSKEHQTFVNENLLRIIIYSFALRTGKYRLIRSTKLLTRKKKKSSDVLSGGL